MSASANPTIRIEIMTKSDCCLCDEAKEVVDEVLKDYPVASVALTDIATSEDLMQQYGEKIPVVLINGEESFKFKVHPKTLRAKLNRILDPQ